MAGIVQIPWYATGFKADRFEAAVAEFAPIALRYGATGYFVWRNRDDRYKFLQTATFEDKADWERYWNGPEAQRFRILTMGWYQVPLLYSWNDVVVQGYLEEERVREGETAPAGAQGDTI
jgi:hypothetical protein